jgi:hypothetical protein
MVVVDVGHSIALYTDWTRMGGRVRALPRSRQLPHTAEGPAATERSAQRLRAVWTDPLRWTPAAAAPR